MDNILKWIIYTIKLLQNQMFPLFQGGIKGKIKLICIRSKDAFCTYLSGGCQHSRYPPQLKYWMPIHYDTIEDGQNKKSHLLFSFSVRMVLFMYFIGGIYRQKYHYIISFGFIWIITPLVKINVHPRIQNHCVAFVTRVNLVCVQMRHAIRGVHAH